jgi:hypothetical protein
MKKITLIIAVVLMAANALFAQVTLTRVWERSDSLYSVTTDILNQKPAYFNDQNTRGIAVGTINSNTGPVDRVFLVSRNTLGNVVRVLNINTGADVKSLNMDATVISGGTFVISDAAMTEDGVLLVSNLNGTGGAGDLKLYKWDWR